MRPQDWDALAEAAQWSRSNADVLVDTHWIGGDPAKGEIRIILSSDTAKLVISRFLFMMSVLMFLQGI